MGFLETWVTDVPNFAEQAGLEPYGPITNYSECITFEAKRDKCLYPAMYHNLNLQSKLSTNFQELLEIVPCAALIRLDSVC